MFDSMKGQGVDETKLFQQQIDQIQRQIQRLDFLLTDTSIGLDVETAKKYASDLAELRPKLARLLKKQQTRPDLDPEETITNFYYVLSHLETEFQKQSIDVQKQMMTKLVKQVTVNNLSPHLFSLYIVWQDGIAIRPDVALLWRGVALKEMEGWSEEEDAIIRTHWPKSTEIELMRQLPLRTRLSISVRASQLGVKREVRFGRKKVNMYDEAVAYADIEAAMQHAEEEDKAYICEIVNEMAAKTNKGEITAYWPLPVDIVGFCPIVGDEEWQSATDISRGLDRFALARYDKNKTHLEEP